MAKHTPSAPRPKKAKEALPASLRKPAKKNATEEERVALFRELLTHYDLSEVYSSLLAAPRGPQKERLAVLLYSGLAIRLVRDFVPAFGTPGGRPERFPPSNLEDWIKAGGGPFTWPRDMKHFYQAQFVDGIQRLEKEKQKSREWVFAWLDEKKAGRHAAERRTFLPKPYQGCRTKGSLREAFNAISKSVRDNPAKFLPEGLKVKRSGHPSLLDELLSKLGLPPMVPTDEDAPRRGLF